MKFLRSLSLMLAMIFFMGTVVPSGAHASDPSARIETAFDRFNYAMNVEWDQQDPFFKVNAERELTLALNGVDVDTLRDFTANSFTDAQTREDFLRMVNAIKTQNLSQDAAVSLAQDWASQDSVGLNFMGPGGGLRCGLVCKVAIVILIVVVIKSIHHHKAS